MRSRFRYSIGNLLVTFVVVALVLTVVLQHGRHLVEVERLKRDLARFGGEALRRPAGPP